MKHLQISSKVTKEIKEKKNFLEENALYLSTISSKYLDYLEKEAIIHSERIETLEKVKKSHIVRDISKNLANAYRWGWKTINKNGFESINDNFIRVLAFAIEPKYFINMEDYTFDEISGREMADFRKLGESVRVGNSRFSPPSSDKLEFEMGRYLEELHALLNHKSLDSRIEGAIYAHLHLARIHPFGDSNGRTARMLQNIILKSQNLPPPLIYAGKRLDYYNHLEEALVDWRSRTGQNLSSSKGERGFYNYLSGEISGTLDRIIDHEYLK